MSFQQKKTKNIDNFASGNKNYRFFDKKI